MEMRSSFLSSVPMAPTDLTGFLRQIYFLRLGMILKEQRTSGTLISLDHTPDLLKFPLLMEAAIMILVGFLSLRLTAAGKLGLSNLLPSIASRHTRQMPKTMVRK